MAERDPGDEAPDVIDYIRKAYQPEETVCCAGCGDPIPPGYQHEDCGRADGPVIVPCPLPDVIPLPDLTDLEV